MTKNIWLPYIQQNGLFQFTNLSSSIDFNQKEAVYVSDLTIGLTTNV